MKLTREMLESVAHLSSADAASALGAGKTTVTEARQRFDMRRSSAEAAARPKQKDAKKRDTIEKTPDGTLIITSEDTVPVTEAQVTERMKARGFDPEKYSIGYRFSEWEAQSKGGEVITMYSARASATERNAKSGGAVVPTINYDEMVAVIERNSAASLSNEFVATEHAPNTFVFNFADPQLGKTDINGGTEDTVERFMNSLSHAEALLKSEPTNQIIWADLGDGIENFCNTSSQRQTNDLNLVEQVRILRRLQVEGLSRLSRFAPIVHASVPSNHSQNRIGFQQPASTSHDDWGIEVQEQLSELFAMTDKDITFVRPSEHLESVAITTMDGTRLGFVHGHRSNSQNGLEAWWAGQSLGRQPTHDADILLVGHFHNLSVRSVGNERYIVTTPSLDNGSSWFTVSRGSVATAGVLTMRLSAGKFRDLLIV